MHGPMDTGLCQDPVWFGYLAAGAIAAVVGHGFPVIGDAGIKKFYCIVLNFMFLFWVICLNGATF
jgi:hypothetical protein